MRGPCPSGSYKGIGEHLPGAKTGHKMTMKNMPKNRLSTQRGFSLIELVVVMGMMAVLSAITMPSALRSMSVYRLNDAATSMQNIVEVARYNAIRYNTHPNLTPPPSADRPAFSHDSSHTYTTYKHH